MIVSLKYTKQLIERRQYYFSLVFIPLYKRVERTFLIYEKKNVLESFV